MSSYNNSRKPLHMQPDSELSKSGFANPSYESFRENEIFTPNYREMENRATVHQKANIARYPNGDLDYAHAVGLIMMALQTAEIGGYLTPLQESFLTVLFPVKFRYIEPQLAEIRTQLSETEKDNIVKLIEAELKEENNWNASRGGGSVPGRTRTVW